MKPGDETITSFGELGADPLVGARIDDYEVQSVIGAGAMGIVYRVQHAVIGKPAALKVLKPDYADDPDMVQRLIREARTVNAIRHPGIVDIFGFGTLPNGQPYIVMDLLEGEPLDAWVKREAPAPFKKVAPILDEILGALHAAHQVGVIHRDLKPGNVFYESHPAARSHVKIIDFGLARQADRAGGSVRPTNPGTLLGTPAFMAPEQVLGTKVFPATDLYAVGGIAYQMLTGRIPHEAPSAIEVLSQKMKFDPVPPKQWAPTLDDDVDSWVMMMLDREPERRPESADDARVMLRRIAEGRTRSDEKLQPVQLKPTMRVEASTALIASVAPPPANAPPPSNAPPPRRSSGSQPPFQAPRSSGSQPPFQPPRSSGSQPPGPAPAKKGTGQQSQHQPQAGVVPKRQWGEVKTVLVDPTVDDAPSPRLMDSSTGTDPVHQAMPPGNETLLNSSEPTAKPEPSPFPQAPFVNKTMPIAAIEVTPGSMTLPPGRGEDSGRMATDEAQLPASRSKLPFIAAGLVAIILAALAVLFFSSRS